MSEHPNVATVNSMTTAIFEQDHDALAKIFTDDVEFHLRGPAPAAGDYRGVGGVLEGIGSLVEMTGGQIDLDQQLCLGTDGWAIEFEYATLGRPGGNGSKIVSKNALVYRFDADRIAEMWLLLGVLPQTAETFFAA